MKVVPNPVVATSSLILDGNNVNDDFQIEIYNLTGIKLSSGSIRKKFLINRTDFQPGVYFYKVFSKTGNIYPGKFIIL